MRRCPSEKEAEESRRCFRRCTLPGSSTSWFRPFIRKWAENEPFLKPRTVWTAAQQSNERDTDIIVDSAVVDYQRQYADDPERPAELHETHPLVEDFDGTDPRAVDGAFSVPRTCARRWPASGARSAVVSPSVTLGGRAPPPKDIIPMG